MISVSKFLILKNHAVTTHTHTTYGRKFELSKVGGSVATQKKTADKIIFQSEKIKRNKKNKKKRVQINKKNKKKGVHTHTERDTHSLHTYVGSCLSGY